MDSLTEVRDEFREALDEVESLLQDAHQNAENNQKYIVYCKAAILLLAAKLECFLESSISAFAYELSKKRLYAEQLPLSIRFHLTKCLVSEEFVTRLSHEKDSALESLQSIANLWSEGTIPDCTQIDSRFNYGKHGEFEVKKLYKRIGIDDIFDRIHHVASQRMKPHEIRDSKPALNSIVGYRNNIIHQDGSPSITHQQIEQYVVDFTQLSDCLEHALRDELMTIGVAST